MQPNDSTSVPRRSLDVEDYIDILRRHRGWIFGPFLFVLVATVVGVYLWPDSYESKAIIRITPQQIPENMIPSAINQALSDRVSAMQQVILSRNVLTTIIKNFGLYKREQSRMPMEDVVEDMRKKIIILPVGVGPAGSANTKNIPAFQVLYSYEDRILAQRVVQDLTTRFLDESIRNRTDATFQTAQFLQDEVNQAKKELDLTETKLAEFRMQNNGKLPDQVEGNLRQMTALNSQVAFLDSQINRAQGDRLKFQSELTIMRERLLALKKEPEHTVAPAPRSEKLYEAERELAALENALSVARQRFTETHPDVVATKDRLEIVKKRRDEIVKDEEAKKAAAPNVKPVNTLQVREQREVEENITRIQSAIAALDTQIEQHGKEQRRNLDMARAFQGRIESAPLGDRLFSELLREREMAKTKYLEMSSKLGKAQVAKEMEARKQGELLDILDPASLASRPTDPKREIVIPIGAALGLLLGVAIAGAREMKNTSLKNLKDVRAYTQMAILGSIPLLENDFVVRRRKRLAWLGWTTASLASVVVMVGSVVFYYAKQV
jgi:polysaccharide chain length determinant protein (PEP-CTERM system associated)